jgi:hypothetical protein
MAGCAARRKATRPVGAVVVAAVAVAAGCARGPTLRDGVYRVPDARAGFRIAAPPGDWMRVDAEGADLALRRADGVALSVANRCDAPAAAPEALARQLRLGLGAHRLLASETLDLAGAPAHAQRLAVEAGGRTLFVATRTRVAPPCVQDFVLVAPSPPGEAESIFDAWCASFAAEPR